MAFEVEQKFSVPHFDSLTDALKSLGGKLAAPRREVDQYYNHPARDFAVTDEALRLRTVGSESRITYKGPKIDRTTKTRREIELPLTGQTVESWAELLKALGFRPVAEVRKHRRKAWIAWEGQRVEVSLDDVDEVGPFVELELMADASSLESARGCIASLAQRLGLEVSERRSYLELLLERRQGNTPA